MWSRCMGCFAKEGSHRTFSPFTHFLPVWFIGKTWKSAVVCGTYAKWAFLTASWRMARRGGKYRKHAVNSTGVIIWSRSTCCTSFSRGHFSRFFRKMHLNFHPVTQPRRVSVKSLRVVLTHSCSGKKKAKYFRLKMPKNTVETSSSSHPYFAGGLAVFYSLTTGCVKALNKI